MKKSLCAIVLLAQVATAQDMGMGADNNPIIPNLRVTRKPWAECGKTYLTQFDKFYQTITDPEHVITRKERKVLEKEIIPYAMSSSRQLDLRDLDGDGLNDFISVQSKSRVSPCSIDSRFLEKENRFYIERKDGSITDVNWTGPLIESFDIIGGSPMIRVHMRDEFGKPSVKYVNWKVTL